MLDEADWLPEMRIISLSEVIADTPKSDISSEKTTGWMVATRGKTSAFFVFLLKIQYQYSHLCPSDNMRIMVA